MNIAIRLLREELAWNRAARSRLQIDRLNPRIPAGLVAAQIVQIDREADELEWALDTLGYEAEAVHQPSLFGSEIAAPS